VKKALGAAGVAIFIVLGFVNLYLEYYRGHTVKTLKEYCDYISGVDLNRRHNVRVMRFDCRAIRDDFAGLFSEQLAREYIKEEATLSLQDAAGYAAAQVRGRALFVTYRGKAFHRHTVTGLTSGSDPNSCWDDATRGLFDVVSADLAWYEQVTLPVEPVKGPCASQ